MDIYKFLNSKDVANYLKSIDYNFSALQCAVLVVNSKRTSINEKIAAWKEIIATMPDCEIPATEERDLIPSLHAFLKSCIEDLKGLQKEFFAEGDFLYTYKYVMPGVEPTFWQEDEGIFKSFEELKKDVDECCSTTIHNAGRWKGKETHQPTVRYRVYKQSTGDSERVLIANFYKSKITFCRDKWEPTDVETLEDVFIDIPTPFKCGDVLYQREPLCWYKPEFVLYCMPNWKKEDYDANGINYEREISNPDSWIDINRGYDELSAYAYFTDDNGEVYHQHPEPYFDFEYYRGGMGGYRSALKPISDYLKGGKGLEYLLNRYVVEFTNYQNKDRRAFAGGKYDED